MGWQGHENVNKPLTYRGGGVDGDTGVAVWWLKATLVSAGWTVVCSGDGLGLDVNADCLTTHTNRWRRDTDPNDFCNTNCWFVVRAPTGTLEVAFWRSTVEVNFQVKVSPTGFIDNALRGVARPPDAADQQCICGALPATHGEYFNGGNIYAHAMASDTPVNGVYPWLLAATIQGTQVVAGLNYCEALQSPIAADLAPWVAYLGYRANSGLYNHIDAAARCFGWRDLGGATELWTAPCGNYPQHAVSRAIPGVLGTQPDGYYRGMPIVYATAAGACWKGIGSSVVWAGSARTYPNTVNVASAADVDTLGRYEGPRLYVGNVLIPWPRAEVPL